MDNQSSGRTPGGGLGAAAGAIIIAAFFLPWVQACNTELSGYDIASDSSGTIENAWVYWIVPIVGVILIALFFSIKTRSSGGRIGLGVFRLFIGLLAFLPVLNIWNNAQKQGGWIEIMYGGWILAAGFVGIFLSFLVDLISFGDGGDNDDGFGYFDDFQ